MKTTDADNRARRAALAADDEAFEALLARAARLERRPVSRARGLPGSRRWVRFGAAAALVIATALWLGVPEPSELPAAVMAHVRHEPASLVRTEQSVPAPRIDEVLRQAGAELARPVGLVTYVKLCPFRGRMVAHFVVQGEQGPVTVLLLPEENVVRTTPVREDGFVGTLVPLEIGGSIAIVGEPRESLDAIRDRLVSAVRWQL
jgi:hypothetical protein